MLLRVTITSFRPHEMLRDDVDSVKQKCSDCMNKPGGTTGDTAAQAPVEQRRALEPCWNAGLSSMMMKIMKQFATTSDIFRIECYVHTNLRNKTSSMHASR
jgi:hypothetical protein